MCRLNWSCTLDAHSIDYTYSISCPQQLLIFSDIICLSYGLVLPAVRNNKNPLQKAHDQNALPPKTLSTQISRFAALCPINPTATPKNKQHQTDWIWLSNGQFSFLLSELSPKNHAHLKVISLPFKQKKNTGSARQIMITEIGIQLSPYLFSIALFNRKTNISICRHKKKW